MQTAASPLRRLTKLVDNEESRVWECLWENTVFDKQALLERIPNASPKTEKNLQALIMNRVLYPDGTVNGFVERYVTRSAVKLLVPSSERNRAHPNQVLLEKIALLIHPRNQSSNPLWGMQGKSL